MSEDPRDRKYYKLQKKDLSQLSQQEIAEYISYCDKMIDYVGSSKKARRGWIVLKKELEAMSE
jgi:hypothetical protein